jgi:transposase
MSTSECFNSASDLQQKREAKMEMGRLDIANRDAGDLRNMLFLALELSRATWVVATFVPRLGDRISIHAVRSGDMERVHEIVGDQQKKLRERGVENIRTVSCYEAGYDGFWIHRALRERGIENHVLDGASIPVDRRAKHLKTDNVDARRLLKAIVGFVHGDAESCRIVRVPTPEDEDARRLHRERHRLVRERTGHISRIKGLLITHGIRTLRMTDANWCRRLDEMTTGDGRPLPERLRSEIEREWVRLKLIAEQIRVVEAERDRLVKSREPTDDANLEKMRKLVRLRGIGPDFATAMTREVFWRRFDNRRQIGSFLGLAPVPYASGDMRRDQGMNKAGNARARHAAVQMAWMWLRHQPQSELAQWYFRRVGQEEGRVRQIMIIALARKLVIALWRYVETGKVPIGAIIAAA